MGDFSTWLEHFESADTPVGELARLAAADPCWPRGPHRFHAYTEHLESGEAGAATLGALLDAWVRWASHTQAYESPRD
ncbi:YozE family protein [Streptomyces sp. NPDC059989]|uniref:YozE family protein n=1 Tax=Streptomyces sp. NPDC059989 TaxID=3347026 RepID=UPI00367F721B